MKCSISHSGLSNLDAIIFSTRDSSGDACRTWVRVFVTELIGLYNNVTIFEIYIFRAFCRFLSVYEYLPALRGSPNALFKISSGTACHFRFVALFLPLCLLHFPSLIALFICSRAVDSIVTIFHPLLWIFIFIIMNIVRFVINAARRCLIERVTKSLSNLGTWQRVFSVLYYIHRFVQRSMFVFTVNVSYCSNFTLLTLF